LIDLQNALKKLKNDKGFALIITIMIVALIIPLTLQFNDSMYQNKISAATHKYDIQLNCAAKSGFHYALAVLYEDANSTTFDSKLEAWADENALNSDTGSAFEDVKFEVKIEDLSGKINVNLLVDTNSQGIQTVNVGQEKILRELLQSLELESGEEEITSGQIEDFVNSLKDWIDEDDEVSEEGGIGAENTDYQGSVRIDGPIEDREDLAVIAERIEWITDDMLEGTLLNYLTIYGGPNSKININTAKEEVLDALSDDITDAEAGDLHKYRMDPNNENSLNDINWYKTALGIAQNYIDPNLVTVSSTHFEIKATGSRGKMKKTITAIVERDAKGAFKVLYRKVE
jgi:general secretion pathway protein K